MLVNRLPQVVIIRPIQKKLTSKARGNHSF